MKDEKNKFRAYAKSSNISKGRNLQSNDSPFGLKITPQLTWSNLTVLARTRKHLREIGAINLSCCAIPREFSATNSFHEVNSAPIGTPLS